MLDTPKAQSDQVLSLNDDLRRRARRSLYLLMYLGSNVPVNPGVWSIRLGRDHGQARVGFFPDGHMERHFPKERYAKTLGFLVCAAVSENIRACAAAGAKKTASKNDTKNQKSRTAAPRPAPFYFPFFFGR